MMKASTLSVAVAFALGVPFAAHAQQTTHSPDCSQAANQHHAQCVAARKAACEANPDSALCKQGSEKMDAETIERITVIGTRFGINVSKYPGSASVILPEELDSYPDVLQSLQNIPGIDIGNDYGRAIGQGFSIRGFGHGSESRVILMQDGVRRSANLFSNQVSGLSMDADLLKQVDVVRGSSGISYGGGAIGGVIGSTTKDASDFIRSGRTFSITGNYRFDSNNQNSLYGAFAYAPENVPVEFLAYIKKASRGDLKMAGKVEEDGIWTRYVAKNKEVTDSQFFKATWNIGEGHKLAASYFQFGLDVETGWNSLYHAEPSTRYGPVVGERVQKDTVVNYTYHPRDNPWLHLTVNAFTSTGYYERGYERGIDLYYKNLDERWGFSAQNLMEFATGNVQQRLLLGMDYENREEDAIFLRDGELSDFGSLPNRYRDMGVFIQHESRWVDGRLILQLGGRYDSFNREVKKVAAKYKNSQFSPRVGMSFEVFDKFNILANYSRAFRAPTPHETSSNGPLNPHYWYLPNPDLQAETSSEVELGFSWVKQGLWADGDRAYVKLMGFKGKIDDMIYLTVDYGSKSPADSEYATYKNVAGVERKGFELEASYDQERWGANLTFASLDMVDVKTGKKSPSAFADVARLGLKWRPFNDDVEFSVRYSHWFKPEQNPEFIVSRGTKYYWVREPFNQTDLQVRWRPWNTNVALWDDSMTLIFGINNVFNQKRMSAGSIETSSRTGLARNVYLSLTKQF